MEKGWKESILLFFIPNHVQTMNGVSKEHFFDNYTICKNVK